MAKVIYFDYAASTPLHPRALEAMLPFLTSQFANPSSPHRMGRQARKAVEDARRSVAEVLDCRPTEITFTSGGTESVNAALKGVAFAQRLAASGDHIVTTSIEHHAVLHTCQYLEKFGFQITYLPVDEYGLVDPDDVAAALTPRTALLSVMLANNEVGTIEPVADIARIVQQRGRQWGRRIPIHTDAVQAPGMLDLNVDVLGVDLLSLSAHKFGGPKGGGVLYMRRGTPFLPQQTGGGQERQHRAGTEDVAAIVGTATALQLAQEERLHNLPLYHEMQQRLIVGIGEGITGAHLNGHPKVRLPNNVNFSLDGIPSEELLKALDSAGIAASAGSACSSEHWQPSHVLLAMGMSLERAAGSLRITFGPNSTEAEVDRLLAVLPGIVARLRSRHPSEVVR